MAGSLATPLHPALSCAHRLLADTPALLCTDSRCLQECHCMLFLTEDNDFRGEDQNITLTELVDMTKDL